MIKPGEIQLKAREFGVRDQQIEKDYVLSWILKGIAHQAKLSRIIIFKGGTVLKKIYFPDYRFSEDLDFTLISDDISNEELAALFKDAFQFIKSESNIPLDIFENNIHEDGGFNFYISFIGPLGGQGINKKVKVDISRNELMMFAPVNKEVFKTYSDLDVHNLLCYSLEEVLIEKMRSVMQRMQARDLYDIWYLLEQNEMDIDFNLREFERKCSVKNLNAADFLRKLSDRMPQYKGRWQSSFSEQIKDLPDFDKIERELQRHLKKLR